MFPEPQSEMTAAKPFGLRAPTDRFQYWFLKRTLDLSLGLVLLGVCLPVLLVIVLALKLTSAQPVLFRQERIGLKGNRFWIYKFRTMQGVDRTASETRWTTPDDDRVTRLGRYLRNTSLDELPQLINVIRGEMSLVGPRPERPYFVEIFKQQLPNYMARHDVKCGITGWAQINGWRGNTSIGKRLEYDLYYRQHWDLWLDFRILGLTLRRGFRQRNAY